MGLHPGHCVAIFGGAVAGAEAAERLSRKGIYTVVFEQNALSYGKIEDGLPKWHVKLRDKEEAKIDEKLDHPYVTFVPKVRLGHDLLFEDVVNSWGFSAVLLAVGAWRDRPLPISGIDGYIDKGLVYQNPFIYWFNHYHEPAYGGQTYEVPDEVIVVGGGLASIDVVKVLMLVTVQRALAERGHDIDILRLEKESPAKVLGGLGLTLTDLGLKGCTLYYRRNAKYMPLNTIPDGADERRIAKAYEVRERMLNNLRQKYLFNFQECLAPSDMMVEDDRLAGLVFQRTEIIDGRVKPIPDAFVKARGSMVISSIGSIPEELPGLPMRGSVFDVLDEATGKVRGYDNVFALGNAVTGRGNIKESRVHGISVSEHLLEEFLEWDDERQRALTEAPLTNAAAAVAAINDELKHQKILSADAIGAILARAQGLQERAGYTTNYADWRSSHLPKRLEDMLDLT